VHSSMADEVMLKCGVVSYVGLSLVPNDDSAIVEEKRQRCGHGVVVVLAATPQKQRSENGNTNRTYSASSLVE